MSDEEIIELAEKVKKQKYCPKYRVCGIYECHISCPNSYVDDILGVVCSDTSYDAGFLDGFKAAYNILKIDVNKLNR